MSGHGRRGSDDRTTTQRAVSHATLGGAPTNLILETPRRGSDQFRGLRVKLLKATAIAASATTVNKIIILV
jgi:hypothetical protein